MIIWDHGVEVINTGFVLQSRRDWLNMDLARTFCQRDVQTDFGMELVMEGRMSDERVAYWANRGACTEV